MASVGPPFPLLLALVLGAAACGSAPPPPAPVPLAKRARVGPRARPTLRADVINRAARPTAASDKQLDPEPRRFLLAHLGEAAVAPSKEPPPPVTAVGLGSTAEGETVGLTPGGPVESARLAEGQRLELPWALSAGDCVTFVAQGGLGTSEVDVFLAVGAGEAPSILAQDEQLGPVAVIGGRRGCFRNPRAQAVEARLLVMLRRGAGPVLVRGYRQDAPAAAPPEKK